MEEVLHDNEAIAAKRQHIADWIYNIVQPVAKTGNESAVTTEQITQGPDCGLEVREYQLDAWSKLWEARASGASSGLIHMATGLGKTSVAVFDIIKFCEEKAAMGHQKPRVLFVCHKNEILGQAAERFAAFVPSSTRGFFNGQARDLDADITFATFQSLNNAKGEILPDYFDYIVYDEAHHAKAESFESVVKYFKPQFQLALTATPNRLDKLDIRQLFGKELYSKGLAAALVEGWLAHPDYHIVFDDAVKELMESGFEATSLSALSELFRNRPRNEVIAQNIREEMHKQGLELGSVKTIIFCQDVLHCEEMASLLKGKAYHSGIEANQRQSILDEFRRDELQVICTRDMFNEGLDIPDARLLVFLRSTSSQTIFEQQLGRGLRKSTGKETVTVLDFVANIERITLLKDLAEDVRENSKIKSNQAERTTDKREAEQSSTGSADYGLSVHTRNANFDFDSMVVELLDKYEELNYRDILPDEYTSFRAFAKDKKVGEIMLARIMKELGLDVTINKIGGKTIRIIDSKDLELISAHPELQILSMPGDFVSLTEAADRLGISAATLSRYVDSLGWELPQLKTKSGQRAVSITDSQIEYLKNTIALPGLVAEEGWFNTNSAAKRFGVSQKLIKKIVNELGIETVKRRFGSVTAPAISPDQMQLIAQHERLSVPLAPSGWQSLYVISKRNNTTPKAIKKILTELSITPTTFKHHAINAESLSPEDIARLEDYLGREA